MVKLVATKKNRSDRDLLHAFGRSGCDRAFQTLVHRYLCLVYGIAFRRTGDPLIAEEIAQNVFTILANKASTLKAGPTLAGWLCRCTNIECSEAFRREHAYQAKMNDSIDHTRSDAEGSNVWRDTLPLLDEAIGSNLGKSEGAAQKQTERAIRRLSTLLKQKGATITPMILAGGLTNQLAQAAPTGLAITISKGTLAGASTLAAKTLILKTLKTMADTKVKTAAIVAAVTVVPLALQWSENKRLRNDLSQFERRSALHSIEDATPSSRKAQGLTRCPSAGKLSTKSLLSAELIPHSPLC